MTDEIRFEIGKRVIHPVHGPCEITFVGDDRVGVVFNNDRHALFLKKAFYPDFYCKTDLLWKDESYAESNKDWPDSTFSFENPDDENKHYLGSHWQPFYDDFKETLKTLPEIISKAQHFILNYGSIHNPPRRLPASWKKATQFVYPYHREGMKLVMSVGEQNMLESLFPFFPEGGEQSLILKKVDVWANGVEAQITAEWGEMEISFYDTGFADNRLFYENGAKYQFALSGIAYSACKSEIMELPLTFGPEQVEWEKVLAEHQCINIPEQPQTLNLSQLSMFIPLTEGDIDDYYFRGKVVEVNKLDRKVLGQECWKVKTIVYKSPEDDEQVLTILVTEKALNGKQIPAVGDSMEGPLWLQGYLWQH
ncbi:MAG TPA: hypothetical protein PLA03_07415 [Acidobacteriota bacterium]|nr:hypothetical protein [Acidobacteriota bacterium]